MDAFTLFTFAAVMLIAVAGAFPLARWLGIDQVTARFNPVVFDPHRTMNDIISLATVQQRNGPEALVQQAGGLRDPMLARSIRTIAQVPHLSVIRAHLERELFAPLAPTAPKSLTVLTSPMLLIPGALLCMVGAGVLLTSAAAGIAPFSFLGLFVAAGLYTLFLTQAMTPRAANSAAHASREMLSRLVILEGVTALAECQPPSVVRDRLARLFPQGEVATSSESLTQPIAAPLRRAA